MSQGPHDPYGSPPPGTPGGPQEGSFGHLPPFSSNEQAPFDQQPNPYGMPPQAYADGATPPNYPPDRPYSEQAGYPPHNGGFTEQQPWQPGDPSYPRPGNTAVPPPGPKKGKGLMIGLIAGGAALALIIAGVSIFFLTRGSGDTPTGGSGGGANTASTPTAAVRGYLEALAAGDAEAAKSFGVNPPDDSPFVSNEFLKKAVEKNPITEIHVEEEEPIGSTAYINANYRLGKRVVRGDYRTEKINDKWMLEEIVSESDRPRSWGTLDVTINGTSVEDQLTLFPGVYDIDVNSTLLEFSESTLSIAEPYSPISGLVTFSPQISSEGKDAVVKAAQDKLTQCKAVKELAPGPDCGFSGHLPKGVTPKKETIAWTSFTKGTPFENSTPRLDSTSPPKVKMMAYHSVEVKVVGSDNQPYSGKSSVSTVTASISGDKVTDVKLFS